MEMHYRLYVASQASCGTERTLLAHIVRSIVLQNDYALTERLL